MAQRYNPDTGEYEDISEPGGGGLDETAAARSQPQPQILNTGEQQGQPPGLLEARPTTPNTNQPAALTPAQAGAQFRPELEAAYRQYAPNARTGELESDIENAGKYGLAGVLRNIQARGSNIPGQEGGFTHGSPQQDQPQAPQAPQAPQIQQLPYAPENSLFVELIKQQRERQAGLQAKQDAFKEAVRNQLLGQIKSGSEAVDPDKIMNSPEARAYQRLQERALQNFRARQAEQTGMLGTGAVQGGGIGGQLGSNVAQGEQQLGENLYGQQAQLVGRELQAKRQQLEGALRMGAGLLSQDQQEELQRQIGQMDAAIRQHLGQGQLSLGLLNASNQYNLGQGQLGLGYLNTQNQNKQFYDQLGNQNQQFYDQLGANLGYQQAMLNRDAYGSLF